MVFEWVLRLFTLSFTFFASFIVLHAFALRCLTSIKLYAVVSLLKSLSVSWQFLSNHGLFYLPAVCFLAMHFVAMVVRVSVKWFIKSLILPSWISLFYIHFKSSQSALFSFQQQRPSLFSSEFSCTIGKWSWPHLSWCK